MNITFDRTPVTLTLPARCLPTLRLAVTQAARKREREARESGFTPAAGRIDMNLLRAEIAREAEGILNEAIERHIAGYSHERVPQDDR